LDAIPAEKMILIARVDDDVTFLTFGNKETDDAFKMGFRIIGFPQ
jgi:hypothetical protein